MKEQLDLKDLTIHDVQPSGVDRPNLLDIWRGYTNSALIRQSRPDFDLESFKLLPLCSALDRRCGAIPRERLKDVDSFEAVNQEQSRCLKG